MRRQRSTALIAILVIAFGGLALALASRSTPELGLDLQGGASVVLQPPKDTPSDSLDQAIGEGRGDIESRVTQTMQRILDAYRAGVVVQGVAIRQADPPQAVNEAFKKVTAAQQDAQSYINRANAYSLQLTQKAQGEAAAFDKVYEQYRLAPEVTRRRMYYETMERVLRQTDKTVIETPGVTPYLPLPELRRQQTRPEPGAR